MQKEAVTDGNAVFSLITILNFVSIEIKFLFVQRFISLGKFIDKFMIKILTAISLHKIM